MVAGMLIGRSRISGALLFMLAVAVGLPARHGV
jgi:hypothetical protein